MNMLNRGLFLLPVIFDKVKMSKLGPCYEAHKAHLGFSAIPLYIDINDVYHPLLFKKVIESLLVKLKDKI